MCYGLRGRHILRIMMFGIVCRVLFREGCVMLFPVDISLHFLLYLCRGLRFSLLNDLYVMHYAVRFV